MRWLAALLLVALPGCDQEVRPAPTPLRTVEFSAEGTVDFARSLGFSIYDFEAVDVVVNQSAHVAYVSDEADDSMPHVRRERGAWVISVRFTAKLAKER